MFQPPYGYSVWEARVCVLFNLISIYSIYNISVISTNMNYNMFLENLLTYSKGLRAVVEMSIKVYAEYLFL